MTLPEDLEQKLEATRITYPETDAGGVTITGAAITADFEQSVTPGDFCNRIATADEPWRMFGVSTPLATRPDGAEYWKLRATLVHVSDDGDVTDTSPLTIEVAPDWARFYVKKKSSVDRVASFLRVLDDEYGITLTFPDTPESNA